MSNYAIIGPDQIVVNVVVWDGVTPWEHDGEAIDLTGHEGAGIGWTYENGTFVDNRPEPEPEA